MTKRQVSKPKSNVLADRYVYEARTPSGIQTFDFSGHKDLAQHLTPLLKVDDHTASSVAYLAHTYRATINTPDWSIRRVGQYTYTPEPEGDPAVLARTSVSKDRTQAPVAPLRSTATTPKADNGMVGSLMETNTGAAGDGTSPASEGGPSSTTE